MSVGIPKAVVVFGAVNPPQEDIIDLHVHLSATREVSSFSCTLENQDFRYSPGGASAISIGVTGGIGVSRGTVNPADAPVISLKVEDITDKSPAYGENYLVVSGRCWGEKLFRRVVTKTYANVKAEAVVKDLLDNYVGLSHTRNSVELVEDTATTYTLLEYKDAPVWDILEYVAKSSVKPVTFEVGYDFRVAPDGKFEFFPRNSKSSSVNLEGHVDSRDWHRDISRVRNKIFIHGINSKEYPIDVNQDDLTEALANWTTNRSLILSTNHVTADGQRKYTDARSIESIDIVGYADVWLKRVLPNLKCGEVDGYKQVSFWTLWKCQGALERTVKVRMYSSANDYFETEVTALVGLKEQWQKIKLILADQTWALTGAPNWNNITAIQFLLSFPSNCYPLLRVDHLFFYDARFYAMRENADSQGLYGLRELSETDEELVSDNECDLRAQSLLAYLKDPAESLTVESTSVDYGTTPILAGDFVYGFRVDSVDYMLDAETQTLRMTLDMGKIPPHLTDYMYGLRSTTVNVEKLARTKLGKGALMVGVGAGGGGSTDEFSIITINEKAVFKDPAGSGNYIDTQVAMVQDPLYPDIYNPILKTTQGIWAMKDVASFGFLGTASPAIITFGATYTPCVESDVGKAVKDDGVRMGTLGKYDNTLKKWWISSDTGAPIASGSAMTITNGTGAGTTNAVSAYLGGAAVLMGHGFTAVTDMPRIVLTDSGFDVLEILKSIATPPYVDFAKLKLNTIYVDYLKKINGDNWFPIGYGNTTFADQNLLQASDAIFNSCYGVSALKAGALPPSTQNVSIVHTIGHGFITSHYGSLILGSASNIVALTEATSLYFGADVDLFRISENWLGTHDNLIVYGGQVYIGNKRLYEDGGYLRSTSAFVCDNALVIGVLPTGATDLYINASNIVSTYSSSLEYKENIESLTDCSWIYDLNPVLFDWKDKLVQKELGRSMGMIAEEVYKIEPKLVWLNKKGNPEGVHYKWLGIPMLVELKRFKKRIEEQDKKIEQLAGGKKVDRKTTG